MLLLGGAIQLMMPGQSAFASGMPAPTQNIRASLMLALRAGVLLEGVLAVAYALAETETITGDAAWGDVLGPDHGRLDRGHLAPDPPGPALALSPRGGRPATQAAAGIPPPAANNAAMPSVELERTMVKSPPELWEELSSEQGLSRWLGDVRVSSAEPPNRLEWDSDVARGVIELEASGWGTTRACSGRAIGRRTGSGWALTEPTSSAGCPNLLDDLGSSSLTSG